MSTVGDDAEEGEDKMVTREVGRAARMVRAARAMRGHTQQDLADLLSDASGADWTRNGVAGIENGHRKLAADELPLFSFVQQVPVTWYLEDPQGPPPVGGVGTPATAMRPVAPTVDASRGQLASVA